MLTVIPQGILLGMTLYKSVYISWDHNALARAPWYTYTRTTMSSLLLRDGVLSYIVVLQALLFTAFGVFIPGVSSRPFHLLLFSTNCYSPVSTRGASIGVSFHLPSAVRKRPDSLFPQNRSGTHEYHDLSAAAQSARCTLQTPSQVLLLPPFLLISSTLTFHPFHLPSITISIWIYPPPKLRPLLQIVDSGQSPLLLHCFFFLHIL